MKQIIRLTESDLHRLIKESAKQILSEIDLTSMPINADANGRNKWWKDQTDADFPNHGIQNSKDWQGEYYGLQGQKDAAAKTAAKAAKRAKLDEYKEIAKTAYQEFMADPLTDDETGEQGFWVDSSTYGVNAFIYDRGMFNFMMKGEEYDYEILDEPININQDSEKDIIAYYIATALERASNRLVK